MEASLFWTRKQIQNPNSSGERRKFNKNEPYLDLIVLQLTKFINSKHVLANDLVLCRDIADILASILARSAKAVGSRFDDLIDRDATASLHRGVHIRAVNEGMTYCSTSKQRERDARSTSRHFEVQFVIACADFAPSEWDDLQFASSERPFSQQFLKEPFRSPSNFAINNFNRLSRVARVNRYHDFSRDSSGF
jgi:hypothetical protein